MRNAGTQAARYRRNAIVVVIALAYSVYAIYADVESGMRKVIDHQSNVFFAEHSLLLALANNSPASNDLTVLDRHFTYLPIAIGMLRGEDDLRLLVDRTLSRLFASPEFPSTFSKWFGHFDGKTQDFFRFSGLLQSHTRAASGPVRGRVMNVEHFARMLGRILVKVGNRLCIAVDRGKRGQSVSEYAE
jgi:hypothetical protein